MTDASLTHKRQRDRTIVRSAKNETETEKLDMETDKFGYVCFVSVVKQKLLRFLTKTSHLTDA